MFHEVSRGFRYVFFISTALRKHIWNIFPNLKLSCKTKRIETFLETCITKAAFLYGKVQTMLSCGNGGTDSQFSKWLSLDSFHCELKQVSKPDEVSEREWLLFLLSGS